MWQTSFACEYILTVYQSKKKVVKEGVDDLVLLPKVSEDQIVDNLKKRYAVCIL